MIEIGACIIGVIMMAELIAAIHLIKMSDETNKVVRKERERLLTEIRIRMLAAHYSKKINGIKPKKSWTNVWKNCTAPETHSATKTLYI